MQKPALLKENAAPVGLHRLVSANVEPPGEQGRQLEFHTRAVIKARSDSVAVALLRRHIRHHVIVQLEPGRDERTNPCAFIGRFDVVQKVVAELVHTHGFAIGRGKDCGGAVGETGRVIRVLKFVAKTIRCVERETETYAEPVAKMSVIGAAIGRRGAEVCVRQQGSSPR
jgi:hypothetical protein